MKHATPTGLGPVCARRAAPAERDLFGFDVDKAVTAASQRVRTRIVVAAAEAAIDIARGFSAARVRLLGVGR